MPRKRGCPLGDPKNNLPQAGYFRENPKDPKTNIDILAIFNDKKDESIFIIPHKDVENKEETFTISIKNLRVVASGFPFATSLTPEKAEELIATYGEKTIGAWVDSQTLNSWFYTYDIDDYLINPSNTRTLDEILNNLNKEIK